MENSDKFETGKREVCEHGIDSSVIDLTQRHAVTNTVIKIGFLIRRGLP
jgi:hypothetical protein